MARPARLLALPAHPHIGAPARVPAAPPRAAAHPPRRPPPLRASVSFLTSTSATGDERLPTAAAYRLELLGYDPVGRRVFAREHQGERVTQVVLIHLRGEHAGQPVALAPDAVARLRAPLEPLRETSTDGLELVTRVIQRRGLRLGGAPVPVRKFALAIGVRAPAVGLGRQVVTAYLRPRAAIRSAWAVPDGGGTLAVVTFCGSPIGLGADRDAAILITPAVH
ncbi:MAG: hypothetical protein R3B06_31170 [Kofleriaceae bacterium]